MLEYFHCFHGFQNICHILLVGLIFPSDPFQPIKKTGALFKMLKKTWRQVDFKHRETALGDMCCFSCASFGYGYQLYKIYKSMNQWFLHSYFEEDSIRNDQDFRNAKRNHGQLANFMLYFLQRPEITEDPLILNQRCSFVPHENWKNKWPESDA